MLPSSLELFIRDFSATDRVCFYTFRSSFRLHSNDTDCVARNVLVQRTKNILVVTSYMIPIVYQYIDKAVFLLVYRGTWLTLEIE